MAFGGVPFYLNQAERGMSAVQVIDRACFTKDGTLRDEFNKLYISLFDQSNYHEQIVELLAQKSKGIKRNEILSYVDLKTGGTATKIINELEESGFIEAYVPFGKTINDQLFRLSDEFTKFHFDWIKPLGKKRKGNGYWQKLQNKPTTNAWAGFTFESLCLKHIPQIKTALGISMVETTESAWRYQPGNNEEGQGFQIDLIIDRKDATINLCEIKYSVNEFFVDSAFAGDLRNRREIFRSVTKTRKTVLNTMITTFGIKQNEYAREQVDSEITVDALF